MPPCWPKVFSWTCYPPLHPSSNLFTSSGLLLTCPGTQTSSTTAWVSASVSATPRLLQVCQSRTLIWAPQTRSKMDQVDSSTPPPVTTDIVSLVAWLCWALLTLTPNCLKNPVYAMKLTSLRFIDELLRSSGFTFAPGLLQMLQSKTPPSLADLKTLPLHLGDVWGVYLHVLEKPGCRPRICIGSATAKVNGWLARFRQYTVYFDPLPRYYKLYLSKGYKRTHSGLLCWAPNPRASKRILLRTLFMLLEAAFTMGFWSIISIKDYSMPNLCFWKVEDLDYGGLNSHFPIQEGVQDGSQGLTAEQVDALEEALKEAAREAARLRTQLANEKRGKAATNQYNGQLREKNRAEKKHVCNVCNKTFGSKTHLNEHNASQAHLDKAAGITKVIQRPDRKRQDALNKANKTFYCKPCDYPAPSKQALEKHRLTDKHRTKVAGA